MSIKLKNLGRISSYIYGTTRLGDDEISFDERVQVALAAMNSRVWFHASNQYNNALEVLRAAFDIDRSKVPKLIIKLEGNTIESLVKDIKNNIDRLGIDNIDVGQLCLRDEIAENFANGGDTIKELEMIRESGIVKSFVLEVFPWTSNMAYKAHKNGVTKGIIEAFIFYFNPLQRFASNSLWDLLIETKQPIIAMRTVAGGKVHNLRDIPGAAWKEYIQKRAVNVAPIYERSGVKSWTEFCVRFSHSFPNVISTVGASSKISRINEFLEATNHLHPLPKNIIDDITKLHYRWSDEMDIVAEPWTM